MKNLTLLSGLLFIGIITQAQFTDIINFNNATNPQGQYPNGSVTSSVTGDTVFGMTEGGGLHGLGCIFSVRKNGSNFHDMAEFAGTVPGSSPIGSLLLSITGDSLFGMTPLGGGIYDSGCVFSILTNGSGFTVLHNFDGSFGNDPYGSLTFSVTKDSLFGVTNLGGRYNLGCIFSIHSNGSNFTDLYDFSGGSGGALPKTNSLALSVSGDSLFGMTTGGGSGGVGNAFSFALHGSVYTDMLDFTGTNGSQPLGSFVVSKNVLYGMTNEGGANNEGLIFSIKTNGSRYRDLLDFNGTNGAGPHGDLQLTGGVLYGITSGGGTYNNGSIFSIDTDGTNYINLFDFNITNGATPLGSLTFTGGVFYGMTSAGGTNHNGIVFRDSIVFSAIITSITNEVCNGGNLGRITSSAFGGISPYTYSWNPGGSTNQAISGLSAGTYTITVTDNTGSTATATTIITQPPPLSVTTNLLTYAICATANTGSVLATTSGGTSPYTYSWSNGHTNAINTGLSVGTYTITATDSCGATATATAAVYDTNTFLTVTPQDTTLCSGFRPIITFTASASILSNYLWSNGTTTSTISLIGATADTTFWVKSTSLLSSGYGPCVAIDTVKVTFIPDVQTPIIDSLTSDSVSFFITDVSSADYVWVLSDITGKYYGIGDTAWLPVWPRNATLIYYADSGTACQTSDTIHIIHNIPLPSIEKPYPRPSKRGMYLEHTCQYILNTYTNSTNEITPIVNYCRDNHITYLVMDGLQETSPCQVFGTDTAGVDSVDADYLKSFIDSLKTRGRVEEVGIDCYQSPHPLIEPDSNAYSILNYNLDNFLESVNTLNYGLPWKEKIDVLTMDQEFWTDEGQNSSTDVIFGLPPTWPPTNDMKYTFSVDEFHAIHMPMLRSMYKASRECSANNLRVEDYLETPLDPWGYISDTALYQLKVGAMELDSIGLYTDRILLSVYTNYQKVLWDEGDFIQMDSEIGRNPDAAYYKKEIWPVFSAENSSFAGSCSICAYQGGDNFSGNSLCVNGYLSNAEWIEQQYFDSLSYGENYSPFPVFDNNLQGAYSQSLMGADTDFQVLGDMWFDYKQLTCNGITFDTNTRGSGQYYLHYYVTLGHDSQWVQGGYVPSITFTAATHGGAPPYTYTWYNVDNGNPVLYSTTDNTYTDGYSLFLNNYNITKLAVVVKDKGDTNVTDYVCIYKQCKNGNGVRSPVRREPPAVTQTISNPENGVKVYPNPNKGTFTVALSNPELVSGTQITIEIYNTLGVRVYVMLKAVQRDYEMDLSNQPNGIYFYRVLSENGSLLGSGKIIIEK